MRERLGQWDKQFVWHPFTQMKDWQLDDPVVIERGAGCRLWDIEGNSYLDGIASMWTNVHGHCKRELDEALKAQIDRISHSTLLGQANVPSILLAKKLVEITPPALTRVFFSDNGSTAVEVAVKMAYQYWRHRGEPGRCKFLKLGGAYHGDTLGAVGVGGVDLFHDAFKPLLMQTVTAPSPFPYRCPAGERECLAWALEQMEEQLRAHDGTLAAMILEPLIQGAMGMIVHPRGYLAQAAALAKRYDVLLILDEVFTGFGRTGSLLACEQEEVQPDILCLSKGLTGGYLPLAATLATDKVYNEFLGEYSEVKTFFHGHTFTGNQLGSAVALRSIELFEQEKLLEQLQPKIRMLADQLKVLARHPNVGDVRQCGMAVGIELVADKEKRTSFQFELKTGIRVCAAARRRGLLIRPLVNVITLVPPLAITTGELEFAVGVIDESILEVLG